MTADAEMSAGNRDAEVTPATRFNFMGRLSSLPAVVTLWDEAARFYARLKDSDVVVAKTLRLVESGAGLVAEGGRSVVNKFNRQLGYVDDLACRGLDKLEDVYPDVAKKQPGEILKDICIYGCKKCIDAKDYGVRKISDIKAISADVLHYAAHPLQTVSACTTATLAYSQELLEFVNAALDKRMNERGLEAVEGPSSSVSDVIALLTLLDTVALKAQVCVKASITARAAALCQLADDAVSHVRDFFTSPQESADAVNLRHVYLSLRITYVAVFVDRPFFLLRDLFVYVRLSDFLALLQDFLGDLLRPSEEPRPIRKKPIVDSEHRMSSSGSSSIHSDCSDSASDV
ncbi:uncharacterized protein LOC8025149 [Ixodes scapularis]|uniref:uncharacterized protein LOC8025149 n=1 Tax=Ixodes scapularis TaxID=6945 RepID=UPI001A9DC8A7|nr:uncharacterized protein LOC8025149 [Ixodes scapularis]